MGVLSLILCDIVSFILDCSIFVSRPWLSIVLNLSVILFLIFLFFQFLPLEHIQ